MSDPSLFNSKAEQCVHELKEVKTVQKVLQFNIDLLKDYQMKQDRKIKVLEHEMDQYILKLFEPKKENEKTH